MRGHYICFYAEFTKLSLLSPNTPSYLELYSFLYKQRSKCFLLVPGLCSVFHLPHFVGMLKTRKHIFYLKDNKHEIK